MPNLPALGFFNTLNKVTAEEIFEKKEWFEWQNKRFMNWFLKLGKLRDEVLFGDVWEQPELSKRDRSLVTCSVLAALYRTPELEGHLERALDNGVSIDELKGMITHVAFYSGWPTAVNAGRVLQKILEKMEN